MNNLALLLSFDAIPFWVVVIAIACCALVIQATRDEE